MPPKINTTTINYYFITIRFHSNDVPLFNNSLIEYIIPFVEQTIQYYWCIEKDNTVSQHFHAVMGDTWRDREKLEIKLTQLFTKIFKNKKHETLWNKKFQTGAISLSSPLDNFKNKKYSNTLGYVQKEKSVNTRKGTNMPALTLEKNLTLFLNESCINIHSKRHHFKIQNLKGTNILSEMLDFLIVSELKIENLTWPEFEGYAIDAGYSFVNVSRHQRYQVEVEVRRIMNPNKHSDAYSYNTLQGITLGLQSLIRNIIYRNKMIENPNYCKDYCQTLLSNFNVGITDINIFNWNADPDELKVRQDILTDYFK